MYGLISSSQESSDFLKLGNKDNFTQREEELISS